MEKATRELTRDPPNTVEAERKAQKTKSWREQDEVNIENISTSEIVISCIVRSEDGAKALRYLHSAFQLDKPDRSEVRV